MHLQVVFEPVGEAHEIQDRVSIEIQLDAVIEQV